ncbi:MAG: T9SS type A sorting domain-containing protein [Candidatus Kapaibacterium sp.]
MKRIFLLLSATILFTSNIFSEDFETESVYYFTLFPGDVKIPDSTYAEFGIYSRFDSPFTVSRGFDTLFKDKILPGNEFTVLNLSARHAQANLTYKGNVYEGLYKKSAIKITIPENDNTACFVRTRYGNLSDGMTLIEKRKLGKEYIITTPHSSQYYAKAAACYVAIVGVEFNTEVTFTLKGNNYCHIKLSENSKLSYNQSLTRILEPGDVWLLPLDEYSQTLTGSYVSSKKPVAVFSGSNAALSISTGWHNYVIHQEIPVNMWGMEFLVPKIIDSLSWSRINLVKYDTYKDYFRRYAASFNGAYGASLDLYTVYYNDIPIPDSTGNTLTIHTDSVFNVVMTDPNIKYKKRSTLPYLMPILSTNSFSKKAVFHIMDEKTEFINIVYLIGQDGEIPDDLLISKVEDGEFDWKTLKSISPDLGNRFIFTNKDGTYYLTKNITFEEPGTYSIRSLIPFAAYQFGYGETKAFGFPVNGHPFLHEPLDTLAPSVDYTGNFFDGFEGKVYDEPREDKSNRINLHSVYLDQSMSYNVNLSVGEIKIGVTPSVNFTINIKDINYDGAATLVMIDDFGNRFDTTIYIPTPLPYFYGLKNIPDDFNLNLGDVNYESSFLIANLSSLDITDEFELYLIFDSDSVENKEDDITTFQGFEIGNNLKNVNLYPLITKDYVNASYLFKANKTGNFLDSLGYMIVSKDHERVYFKQFVAELSAYVGKSYIQAEDIEFESILVGDFDAKVFYIENPIPDDELYPVTLTINDIEFSGDDIGYDGSGKPFEVSIPTGISKNNPLRLPPNKNMEFMVRFTPQDAKEYNATITFHSDASEPKDFMTLKGQGKGVSVENKEPDSEILKVLIFENSISLISKEDIWVEYLEIYDLKGRKVYSEEIGTSLSEFSIDKEKLSSGLYMINIKTERGMIVKKVLIR